MPLFNRAAVTVGAAEIQIAAANPTRRRIWISNPSANNIRVGPAGVLATTGVRIVAGGVLLIEGNRGAVCPTEAIFGIREAAADAAGVCALEDADS